MVSAASSSSGDTLNCTTESDTHELNTSDFIQNTKMRGILANRAKELYGNNNKDSVWEKPFDDPSSVGERTISDSFSSLIDGKGLDKSSTLTLPNLAMNVTGVLSERLAMSRKSPSRELSLLNDNSTSDDTTISLIGLDSMLANFDNDEETDGKTDDTAVGGLDSILADVLEDGKANEEATTTADLSKLIEVMAYCEEGDAKRRGGETSFVKSTASQGDLANLLEEKNQTSESTPLATSNNAAPTPPTSSSSLSEEYPFLSLSPEETETISNNVAEGNQTLMFSELMQGIENEVSKKSSSLDNEEEDSSEIVVNTKHSSGNKRRDTADTADLMGILSDVQDEDESPKQVTIQIEESSSSSQESKDKTSRGSVGTNASRNEENEKSSSSTTTTQDNVISASKLDCSFLPLIEKKNIVRVEDESYAKLGVIGRGSSSKVYRALSRDCDVVALKKVKLDGLNKAAIDGYANEIALLKRLKGNPAIIQLYSAEVDLERKSILLVMELGEVDLNYVLRQQSKQQGRAGRSSLNMNFIRLTWQQMLTAVHSIHEERIIHSDLKPANFLFVRGALKLIDFGIAKAIEREDTINVYRETLSGTLNYMSPEAIMDTSTNAKGVRVNRCGRPSDIWSLGCILYQMVYGKTPFADCRGIPQKVLAITSVNHEIHFPSGVDESAIDAMKLCLHRNPKERPPIIGSNGLLNEHCFLHGSTKNERASKKLAEAKKEDVPIHVPKLEKDTQDDVSICGSALSTDTIFSWV